MVVEERGLPNKQLHLYGAGWQVHLEDLGRSLEVDETVHPDGWSRERPASAWHQRWNELSPTYRVTRSGESASDELAAKTAAP